MYLSNEEEEVKQLEYMNHGECAGDFLLSHKLGPFKCSTFLPFTACVAPAKVWPQVPRTRQETRLSHIVLLHTH